MNRSVTSKEDILAAARQLLLEEGSGALGMRNVAAACGVAVGSIYNYFPSKSALVSATIESIWAEMFRPFTAVACYDSFADAVASLLTALDEGVAHFPGFFSLHALTFAAGDKAEGRARMMALFDVLRDKLVQALAADANVREDVFDGALSPETFAGYVLTLAISQRIHAGGNGDALLKMVRSCIY